MNYINLNLFIFHLIHANLGGSYNLAEQWWAENFLPPVWDQILRWDLKLDFIWINIEPFTFIQKYLGNKNLIGV